MEFAGYKTIGEQFGKWGNICTGAVAASTIAGLPGFIFGGTLGYGVWVFGEGVGRAIETVFNFFS